MRRAVVLTAASLVLVSPWARADGPLMSQTGARRVGPGGEGDPSIRSGSSSRATGSTGRSSSTRTSRVR